MADRHLLIRILGTTALTSLWPWLMAPPACANPQGATVVGGSALVVTTSPTVLNVDQSTQNAVINWQSFSVGAGEQTNFHQPSTSSLTVNRVTGVDPSTIAGQITANGQIVLTNPNGVVVSQGARVNAGGFIATTSGITNSNAMAGNLDFTIGSNSPTASVVNQGRITVREGGLAALVAPGVENDGVILARLGKVALASGQTFTLDLEGDRLVNFAVNGQVLSQVTEPNGTPLSAAVVNSGRIIANGGVVAISVDAAEGVVNQAINMTGIIQATSAHEVAGTIVLNGGAGGVVNLAGTLDASGNGPGESGGRITVRTGSLIMQTGTITASGAQSGGRVQLAAPEVINQGQISADAQAGNGGSIAIRAASAYVDTEYSSLSAQSFGAGAGGSISITGATAGTNPGSIFVSGTHSVSSAGGIGGSIAESAGTVDLVGATLDASGATGGGSIEVGGGLHGAGALADATTTLITPGTVIDADARTSGNGGNVVVWSNVSTTFAGAISAQGGSVAGNGGMAEVSSGGDLVYAGTADVAAAAGTAGTLLLDPADITVSSAGGVAQYQLIEPMGNVNGSSGTFGQQVLTLSGGNIVVTDPTANAAGISDAGAVYVYNGTTDQLVSMLIGSHASDGVGSGTITTLTNGNFVVTSPNWLGGAGAVTWGSAATGVGGIVSGTNSLVGSVATDNVGSGGIQSLGSGNYLVLSPNWGGGSGTDLGAVTFGSAASGVSGIVGAANSLVGTASGDEVGSGGIQSVGGSNYLVLSPNWGGGSGTDLGAVTFGSGASGVSGAVAAANSLVGTASGDDVGSGGVQTVGGDYVVFSPNWGGGLGSQLGAVTWGSAATGVSGAVSAANSLVGDASGDQVGNGTFTVLGSEVLVFSPDYGSNGTASLALGAVTFGSTAGITGAVSATNSLIGANPGDQVGSGGYVALNGGTGDFVIYSPNYGSNGTPSLALGAVTFGSGSTGFTSGAVAVPVSLTNSLVGSSPGDEVGSGGIYPLLNSDAYVVASPNFSSGSAALVGAVTWGNGSTGGVTGAIASTASLFGSDPGDQVGSGGVTALTDGNFFVLSQNWESEYTQNGSPIPGRGTGAITMGTGTAGFGGATTVNYANSLIGDNYGDELGATILVDGVAQNPIFSLLGSATGNYVIDDPTYQGLSDAVGAVIFVKAGATPSGDIGSQNVLIGLNQGDQVGSGGIIPLSNGNYLVLSPSYGSLNTLSPIGAVSWGSGTAGFGSGGVNLIGSTNSLVGSVNGDEVGSGGVQIVGGSNYLVLSPNWSGSTSLTQLGAVTFGNGASGVSGTVSASNSLVGTASGDEIGSGPGGGVDILSTGNYLVVSPSWGGGLGTELGAVTFGSSATGVSGAVSLVNSLVGTVSNDDVGGGGVSLLPNGNYVVASPNWGGGLGTELGAVTFGSGASGVSGAVSPANSLVGSNSGDQVGVGGIAILYNSTNSSNYVVLSPYWNDDEGAATWSNGSSGAATGTVSATNSLVGSNPGDYVGIDGVTTVGTAGNYLVFSPYWSGTSSLSDLGAVSWGNGDAVGATGTVSAANSLVGSSDGDEVGSNFTQGLFNGNYLILSPNWGGGSGSQLGAVTFGSGNAAGPTGVVSASNSLVGADSGDEVGSGGIVDLTYVTGQPSPLLNGFYVVLSPNADGGAGAITLGNGSSGVVGQVSGANSLVGSGPGAALAYRYFDPTNGVVVATENENPGSNLPGGQVVLGLFDPNELTFARGMDDTVTLSAQSLAAALAIENVTLQANNDITFASGLSVPTGNYSLTLDAGGSITFDSGVVLTLGGSFTAVADDSSALAAERQPGPGGITLMTGASIDPVQPGTSISLSVDPNGADPGAIDLQTGSVLNAGGGTVAISSAGALIADGTVTGSSVLATATGAVTLGGTITASATGAALTLVSGGAFDNTSGAGALVTPNGNWLVYSQNPANDTIDGLAFAFEQYDAPYNTTPAVANADGLLYALAPTVYVSGVTKTYDGTTTATLTAGDYTVGGVVGGDTVTLDASSGSYATQNAGTGINVSFTGLAIASAMDGTAAVYGYQVDAPGAGGAPSAIGTINPAPLTVTALTNTKTYDGTTSAAATPVVTSGMLYGSDTATYSETYASANAGSGIALNPTAAISDPGNYAVTLVANNTGMINPAPLTVTALTNTKTYDGTTSAAATPVVTSGMLYGSDTATYSETYASANAGSGITLNPTAAISDPGNYAVTLVANTTGVINPEMLTVTAAPNTKPYDGTTSAAAMPTITSGTLYDPAVLAETYASKNAGSGLTLTPTAAISDGNNGGNYTVTLVANTTGVINPEMLTVTAAPNTKTYDGTTSAAATPTITSGTLYDPAVLAETYATPNAGSGLTLTPTAAISDGNNGGNYVVTLVAAATGIIDPALLTVAPSDASRVYGSVNPTLTATVSGLEGSDTAADLGLSLATSAMNPGRFVGPAGLGGVTTAGAPVGAYPITATITDANYTLNLVPGTLMVTPATLDVVVSDASRLYGAANPLLTGSVTGLIGSDTAASVGLGFATTAIGGTPNAAGSNAGDYPITATIASVNYTLSTIAGVLAVDPAPLVVAVGSAARYVGQANPPFAAALFGLAGSDTAADIGLSFATTAIGGAGGIGGSPAGDYPITASIASGNYAETLIPGTLAIEPAPANGVANVSFVIPQSFNIVQRTPQFFYLDGELALSGIPPIPQGDPFAATGLHLSLIGTGTYQYLTDYFGPIVEGLLLPINP